MRVLFVKQDHASPAGLVGEAFTGLGYDVAEFTVVPAERYHSPQVTVSFPDPAGYEAIVYFGAAWAVYDSAATGSWLGPEMAFARSAHALGIPQLGICFGGQMLAAALGGSVTRAPAPEIGWHLVHTDAPGLIDAGPWFQWHFDRFTPPPGLGTVLARTALAPQAWRAGRTLGLQFHPEVTTTVLESWLSAGDGAQGSGDGVDTLALFEQTRILAASAAGRADDLVRRFVTDVAPGPAVPLPPNATVVTSSA